MPSRKDDDDWDYWDELDHELQLAEVPLETPSAETVPIAFRAHFDEVDTDGLEFSRVALWWLMARRLRAFEVLRTSDLTTEIKSSYIEWRVRV